MMSKKLAFVLAAFLALPSVAFASDTEWFNMDRCTMCKPLTQVSGLMESIDHEQLPLSNGIVTVTTVHDQHLKAYRQAHAQMEEIVARVEKGETVPLCGSCTALFRLMPKGVAQEFVETRHGDVWILTSSDPAVAAELKAWAKRNADEMAKMTAAPKKPSKM